MIVYSYGSSGYDGVYADVPIHRQNRFSMVCRKFKPILLQNKIFPVFYRIFYKKVAFKD